MVRRDGLRDHVADHHPSTACGPRRFARGHWGIEDRLHWVRDVTYDEDRSQVRTGNGPRVMASLRNLAIAVLRLTGHASIAAALRYHAREPGRPRDTARS
jgi:predicted transposase YbfD/YdcC